MISRPQTVKVIANPASGRQEQPLLSILNTVFRRYNVRWKFVVTHRYGDGARHARKAVKKGKYDLVIAFGGDGTVRDVANGLIGSELPLAILAGGTGNAVAAELKVPYQLERALEQICSAQGNIQAMDAGQVDDTYFLLRADTGISTKIMQETTREMKERLGVLAYLLTFARTFAEPPQWIPYHLVIDGQLYESQGAACIVTNIGSVGTLGFSMGQSVKFDDGLLDVFILKQDFFSVLSAAASVVDLTNFENVFQHWQGRDIRIETDIPYPVNCDAEPYTHTPIQVKVVPHALNLFVPSH